MGQDSSMLAPLGGLCWPVFELCWPILGLCWPILGLCGPSLRAMRLCWASLRILGLWSGHVDPSWSTRLKKMGKPQNTVNCRVFVESTPGSAAGAGAPVSYGEGEKAYGNATAAGPEGPWPDLKAYARQPARGPLDSEGKSKGTINRLYRRMQGTGSHIYY